MAQNRRWLTAVSKEASKTHFKMPWTRGARRAAFIASRTALSSRAALRANA